MIEKNRILDFLNSRLGKTTAKEVVYNHLSQDSNVSNPATDMLTRLSKKSENKRRLVMGAIADVAKNY